MTCILGLPIETKHVYPLRLCFWCSEGGNNFLRHLGDRLYTKVNLKFALRAKVKSRRWQNKSLRREFLEQKICKLVRNTHSYWFGSTKKDTFNMYMKRPNYTLDSFTVLGFHRLVASWMMQWTQPFGTWNLSCVL
jgi:hypothetical protein